MKLNFDYFTQLNFSGTPRAQNYARKICEPSRPILESFIDDLIILTEELQELGFSYYNGR